MAFVTLRQYRFEMGFAVLAGAVAIALGLSIDLRIDALGVSPDCIAQVRTGNFDSESQDPCWLAVREGSEILGAGSFLSSGGLLQGSIMGLLPFVLGIFGGIPVVAREFEDRTAQTAWWLNASRIRWLVQKVGVIGIVLGIVIVPAALVASLVAGDWLFWYGNERARLIGTHGPLVVLRAFGAFGLGLAMGALFRRTFTAFVATVAVLLLAMIVAMQARDVWLGQLPPQPLYQFLAANGQWQSIGGVPRVVAWGGPDGEILGASEARLRATEGGAAPAPSDQPGAYVDEAAYEWLYTHGYAEITLGVTDEAAAGWAPFDAGMFAVIGGIGVASAFVLVNRRRPT